MHRMRLLMAGAGCALLTSCTQATPHETTTTPAQVTLPSPIDSAYAQFWTAWQAANASLTYDAGRLGEHVADPLLQTLQANLAGSRAENTVSRGEVTHQIRGFDADGDARWITDCVGLEGWKLFDAASGVLIPGQLTGQRTQLTVLVLRRMGTTWKASSMYVSGTC